MIPHYILWTAALFSMGLTVVSFRSFKRMRRERELIFHAKEVQELAFEVSNLSLGYYLLGDDRYRDLLESALIRYRHARSAAEKSADDFLKFNM